MGGPLLHNEAKSKRRRWIVIVTIFAFVAFAISATSVHRGRGPRPLVFPTPHLQTPFSESIVIPHFERPKDIKIVGLVFFGRKDRVEMLRCYLEVRLDSYL